MKYLSRQKICTILFEENSNYMLKENNSAIKLFHNCQPSLICKVQRRGTGNKLLFGMSHVFAVKIYMSFYSFT